MKDRLSKMLKAKQEARAKAMNDMATTDDAEVRAAQLELIKSIEEEIDNIKTLLEEAKAEESADEPEEKPEDEARGKELKLDEELTARANVLPVGNLTNLNSGGTEVEKRSKELEQRGADLRAGKAVTVEARALPITTAASIVLEKKYSRELAPGLNEVSTLIDSVHSVPLQGGESYTKAFIISGGEGDYTAEGAAAADIEPKTGYAEIPKAKITAYAEVTEEIKKLPNVDYASFIEGEVRNALRKKITRQIIAGAGTANTLTGIYKAAADAVPADSDIEISVIDENTLSELVFAYGGDEDVEDEAVLVLSKADLRAFSKVRFADGRKAYKITKHGNTGTIEEADGGVGVNYIINSACNSLSSADTAVGTHTMVYGRPSTYELPIFSDIEIKESEHSKFKEGNIAFRGVVFVGGNVAAYKGWARVKKVAAAG